MWPVLLQRFETFSSEISTKYWQLDKDYKAKEDDCSKLKAEVQASLPPLDPTSHTAAHCGRVFR